MTEPRAGQRKPKASRGRFAFLGASTQAAVPGAYAWALTVFPAAWTQGAGVIVKVSALAAAGALLVGPAYEMRRRFASPASRETTVKPADRQPTTAPARPWSRMRQWSFGAWVRAVSFWGFVLSSGLTWTLAPKYAATNLDATRGLLGALGWLLYALASAGPPIEQRLGSAAPLTTPAGAPDVLASLARARRFDLLYLGLGLVAAVAIQGIGWSVASPERAVLVRVVTVSVAIAIFSATTTIALARHAPRVRASSRVRLRRALPWMLLLALGIVPVILHTVGH